jgi:phage-related protein
MYKILFYTDENGNRPVWDYMQSLLAMRSKDSRIKYNKIIDYIRVLSDKGQGAGQPYIKHIDGDIWELRPIRDRILFAAWDEEQQGFVLLHQFMKQTQKTPQREVDTAKRRLEQLRKGEK